MSGKVVLVLLVIAAIIASMSIFTVDERERAINLQLGEVVRSDYESGLHFKLPLIQEILKFDKRIQNMDSDPQLYLTNEKKNLKVDSFVKWRIADVVRFYTSTGGSPSRASNRLAAVIQKGLKDEFGKRTIQQVVSGERTEIMDKLRLSAANQADELGIDIIDVRLKRIDLPEEVSASVYARMAAEREQVAKKFRSEGEEQGKRIRAEADREREVILAEAQRDAQKIKGDGDARATEIYADAFGQDTEFYSLYRSLDAYRNTFNNPSDVLLVEPNTQFFKYFKGADVE
ncbi:MAG: protease modulator HflC [Gammaproteobacteria bacterium]|nr:protease modulator HflC [Gammaproteobacteria bacterium]NIM72839.1 protease modulator HflC [Gammaproteobacteria bacterium]NIN38297.1 protease modulator HflC [Gammaproteobacteria bacterium]NIO24587.1 protease modulator HflC [Gammaproteobacteria bacterium]NIO65196.1 protease modulator HflC [Gammaproteobacteria bacterium]